MQGNPGGDLVPGGRVGLGLQQELDRGHPVGLAGDVEGRVPRAVGDVDKVGVSPVLDEQGQDSVVAVKRSQVNGALPVVVL